MLKHERCLFCGGAADILCDGYLGWGLAMDGDRRCIDIRKPYTCDASLCSTCVANRGSIHGTHHGMKWFDTIDHCPLCRADGKPDTFVTRIIETSDQARIIRAAHHIRATSKFGHRLDINRGGGQLPLTFE